MVDVVAHFGVGYCVEAAGCSGVDGGGGSIMLGECHESYTQYDCDVHLWKDGDADLGHSMKSDR